jgi:cobalt-zinc-cadmium resistance protein CzcA
VLDRTRLVDATIRTVSTNLAEGALLVIAVLFALLGNLRAAIIAAAVIPVTMLLTSAGMLRMGLSANLMSLGALDFGLIVDAAVIIVENALRRLGEQQHAAGRTLDKAERRQVAAAAAREMIRPSVYGQAIIMLVYVPLLTFEGIEGRMFTPMAVTVILALAFAFAVADAGAGGDWPVAVPACQSSGKPHYRGSLTLVSPLARPCTRAALVDRRNRHRRVRRRATAVPYIGRGISAHAR